MNAADVVGYTHGACFYCVDCLPDGIDPDGEDTGAVFADSEWDQYPVCDVCGEQCEDVSLTSEGMCECGRAPQDCATADGATQHYDRGDEEPEPDEPTEGDWITEDYRTFREHEGGSKSKVVTVGEDEEWRTVLAARMDADKFWPNVWCLSDHGNWHLLSMEKGESA